MGRTGASLRKKLPTNLLKYLSTYYLPTYAIGPAPVPAPTRPAGLVG